MSEADVLMKRFKKAAQTIIAAGPMPFPLTDTFMEILRYYFTDEKELEFIKAFKIKKSMTMDQLQKKLKGWTEEEIDAMAKKIAKKGFIFNQPSSSGLMIYRLMPIVMIGAFEYLFMANLPKSGPELDRIKKLADLYDRLMKELAESVQRNYETFTATLEKQPAFDRTVPLRTGEGGQSIIIDEIVGAEEQVLPAQTVEEIVNKYNDIAVGNCFCRQYRETLGEKFDIGIDSEVCFTFGKSARHVIQQGFGRQVTKEEAMKIMKRAEDAGLIHKAFHNKNDIMKEENSICNCHPAYCDIFRLWREGAFPILSSAFYLSEVDSDKCIGCGTCEEHCPTQAIAVNESNIAEVDSERCIGCAVCAHFCPEGAISMKGGQRTVYIPPPKLKT
ncbi:MAG: ATP-binding protein [Candidatus Helarchaeota archaeon]